MHQAPVVPLDGTIRLVLEAFEIACNERNVLVAGRLLGTLRLCAVDRNRRAAGGGQGHLGALLLGAERQLASLSASIR